MRPVTSEPAPLRSLDLFSGIGGLTLALSGITEPVAYCDVDPRSRAVLEDNMSSSKLPQAPVSSDVRTLDKGWLAGHSMHHDSEPEAIVAGFPCVGFSSAGKRQGFGNKASALFYEIVRLLDEFPSVQWLFLENVPQVLMGMHDIVHELHTRRGFSLRWCIVAARDVGAPHMRRRWFCVAHKAGARGVAHHRAKHKPRRWLSAERQRTMCPGGLVKRGNPQQEARMRRKEASAAARRAFLLGNAVVPDAARHAFLHMLHSSPTGKPGGKLPLSKVKSWPDSGMVQGSRLITLPSPAAPHRRAPLPITLVPEKHARPQGYIPKNKLSPLRGPTTRPYWATPRAGLTGASQVLTERTSRDLPTQVRHEAGTPDRERACPVAPEFLEWLMGYPRGWTRAAAGRL